MSNTYFLNGPLDGATYFRGSEEWRGVVVAANPDRHNTTGANCLYLWDGLHWRFSRYVGADEDYAALCWRKKPSGVCLRDER